MASPQSQQSPRSPLTAAQRAECLAMRSKVALAVAIIKTKPAGQSAREHAEVLAQELRKRDEDWRQEAQRLQQEVLRLRQEVLISMVTPVTESVVAVAAGGDDSETPELLPPLPPSPHRGAAQPHLRLLQALCSLRRLSDGGRSEPLLLSPDVVAVLPDTTCQLLDSVVAACRDRPSGGGACTLMGEDDLREACRVVTRVMELLCSHMMPPTECVRRIEESLMELTGMLLNRKQTDGPPAQEKLTECLLTLGNSSMSRSFLVRHLLEQVCALADGLWRALKDQQSLGLDVFPLDQYQNSYHLFRVLEELLQTSKVPCRAEVELDCSGFLGQLEHRVFALSEEFPLFSIYMWRIGGLLTAPDQ